MRARRSPANRPEGEPDRRVGSSVTAAQDDAAAAASSHFADGLDISELQERLEALEEQNTALEGDVQVNRQACIGRTIPARHPLQPRVEASRVAPSAPGGTKAAGGRRK